MNPTHSRRIGVLVVHGVGDQTCFEHLENIATHMWQALTDRGRLVAPNHPPPTRQQTKPYVQIRRGTDIPYRAHIGTSWREPASSISWWSPAYQRWTEAVFDEIHWSDLKMPLTFWNWLKLIYWAMSIWMVRLFKTSRFHKAGSAVNQPPMPLTHGEKMGVRLKLFFTSVLFFLILSTIGVVFFVLSKFFQAHWIRGVYGLIYNYLGDVKLYQDHFARKEPNLEVIGEKSRVAIRRRMVRAVIEMAKACRNGEFDGYYIVAHSLGTVVAYNALMDAEDILPNYLTYEEWTDPSLQPFKTKVSPDIACTLPQEPRRPPWLALGEGLDRSLLFEHLEGVLTAGSPLNKFAALWPAIVPINKFPIGSPTNRIIPWLNVADCQDIVGGSLTAFKDVIPPYPSASGGLQLKHLRWASAKAPFTAHTSYWKPGKSTDRLVNRMIDWFEGAQIKIDEFSSQSQIQKSRMMLGVWIPLSALCCLLVAAGMMAMLHFWSIRPIPCFEVLIYMLIRMFWISLFVLALVVLAGTTRWLWEKWWLTWWKNRQEERGPKRVFSDPPLAPEWRGDK